MFNWHHNTSVTCQPGLVPKVSLKLQRSPAFGSYASCPPAKSWTSDTFQLSNYHPSLKSEPAAALVKFQRCVEDVHGKTIHHNWGWFARLSLMVFVCCKNWGMNLSITTITSVQILRCTKRWPYPKVEWVANQMDVWRSASYGLKPLSIVLATIKIWGSIASTSKILPLRIGESWSLPTMSTNTHPPMAQHDRLALKKKTLKKLSSRLRWSLTAFPSRVNGIIRHPGKP